MKLEFYSFAPANYRDNLERLFFFNKEQSLIFPNIERALEKYGNPYIENDNDKIRIALEGFKDCQNLILFEEISDKIIGILLHARISESEAEVFHFAIDQNYNQFNILSVLFDEVLRIYKRIKGINYLKITYTKTKLSVRR